MYMISQKKGKLIDFLDIVWAETFKDQSRGGNK